MDAAIRIDLSDELAKNELLEVLEQRAGRDADESSSTAATQHEEI